MKSYRVTLQIVSHVRFDVQARSADAARVKGLKRYERAIKRDPDGELSKIDDRLSDNRQAACVVSAQEIKLPDQPFTSPY